MTKRMYRTPEGDVRVYVCEKCGHEWLEFCDADEYPEYCPGCGKELREETR